MFRMGGSVKYQNILVVAEPSSSVQESETDLLFISRCPSASIVQ